MGLREAIRAAGAGRSILAPHAAEAVIKHTTGQGVHGPRGQALTAREREVLQLMVRGYTNLQIADDLVVSRSTANFHVSSILRKLGTQSRAGAVAVALQDQLVGVASINGIAVPEILDRYHRGHVREVGSGTHSSIELALALDPDVVFTFYSAFADSNTHPKLWDVGITGVPLADHFEPTPLGRSEWMKFVALFFNQERRAEEVFSAIAERYDRMRQRAAARDDQGPSFCPPGGPSSPLPRGRVPRRGSRPRGARVRRAPRRRAGTGRAGGCRTAGRRCRRRDRGLDTRGECGPARRRGAGRA